jgi:primase-polymerase (primpol)-like protein
MEDERRKEKSKIEEIIPQELLKLPNWVGYDLRRNKNRLDKVPMNVLTGRPAKTNDPGTWADFHTAVDLAIQRNYAGIGFMFQPPYVGVDIDHCVKDGVIAPYASEILETLSSYSEYSPSGTGIHILCRGEIARACKISKIGLEIYTKGRFFTVTGNRLTDYPAELNECTEALKSIFSRFVDIRPANDLLFLIAKSEDADKFQRLYSGQWQNDYPSQSEADLALCNKLAFWTGKDAGQMNALFRQSGLMRPKWDEKHFGDGRTYGQSVIEKAINGCRDVYSKAPELAQKAKLTQGEIITRDCEENIKDFFRDQHGNAFVVLTCDDHDEVCPTTNTRFRNWVATRYRQMYEAPPRTDAINQAKIQIEARCESSRQVELFNRVGWQDGAIYYDLTTQDWKGVRIDKGGWQVVSLPPIFRRYQHQAEQVLPVHGGDPKELLHFCNISPDDHCLFMVLAASFFIPNIPHVILSQTGEQGSGKSNNSRKIKSLVDPSRVMLISTPKDLEQAQMTAEKHWISTFDNISKILEWFSDFLCRGVTGEGDMKRSLYTNDDEFIRSYRRCFVLNGIGASMWRADLLDRAIIFDIPILKDTRPERIMDEDWRKSLPGILGGIFTAISKAMNTVGTVNGHEKFRMSDFAQWGGALAEALGYSQDEFFSKYQESVDRKWQDTAEDSAFAKKIIDHLDKNNGYWEGATVELLEELRSEDAESIGTPKTAKWLSTELVRIAPVMRNVGIDITKREKRQAGTGRRIFVIRRMPKIECEDWCEDDVRMESFCEANDEADDERPF